MLRLVNACNVMIHRATTVIIVESVVALKQACVKCALIKILNTLKLKTPRLAMPAQQLQIRDKQPLLLPLLFQLCHLYLHERDLLE